MNNEKGIKIILTVLMIFLLFETVVHLFGLPILAHEHLYDTAYTIYAGRLIGLLSFIWAMYLYLTIKNLRNNKEFTLVVIIGLFLVPVIETWINYSADLNNIIASGPYGIGISARTALQRESLIALALGLLLAYFYRRSKK